MTANGEQPDSPSSPEPEPEAPDEGFGTDVETHDDDPGEGFETERVIETPEREVPDEPSKGFGIERQS